VWGIKCYGEYLDTDSGAEGVIVKLRFKGFIILTQHPILRQSMEDEIGIGLLCGTNEKINKNVFGIH